MRILHTADLHLGKTVNDMNMIDDQAFILHQIVQIVRDKKAEVLIIAGDIYDRLVPPERAVQVLDGFINTVQNVGTDILMISGNHDSSQRLDFGSSLLKQTGVHIAGSYKGSIKKVSLQDAFGDIHFYLLPFIKRSYVQHYFPDETIETYEDAVRVAIQHEDIDTTQRNIMISHQFVTAGDIQPKKAGSEIISSMGTIENVSYSLYAPFDYTALGHIHRPQKIYDASIRYAGSPLKYSTAEVNNEKSVVFIDSKEKGNQTIELIPLAPKRDMRHIKGHIKDILMHATHTEDYIYVTLTDDEIIMDAISRIQNVYPYTLKLDYAFQKQNHSSSGYSNEWKQDFSRLIQDFYQKMYGVLPNDEELKLLKETAKEAGVIHETD